MIQWKNTVAVVALLAVSAVGSVASAASFVEITAAKDGKYNVTFGGKLFTTLHTQGFAKPILYPIVGPQDIRMTRDYPMVKGTADEKSDHPHHQSLWYTHGDVNGVSFWHIGKDAGTIKTVKTATHNSGSSAVAVLNNQWNDAKGKTLLTDTQKITFHKFRTSKGGDCAMIDYQVTLHASEGDVTFGDTKEGTMGIRTHPGLRVNKGATAINSAGDSGKSVWGKAAAWVDYSAKINGKVVGVGIFDHPSNPRHPTTWHARDYGLVAANPFGLSYFQKKPKGAGNLKLKKGDSVTFKYRFVFHDGDAKTSEIKKLYGEWAKEK